mmetsp:Transcript_9364/g.24179  ORF Transcript_9364/g.24179 Transcript_9364/m.24179 type:complete len:487 (-) Transcript_9364:52-1512(-)
MVVLEVLVLHGEHSSAEPVVHVVDPLGQLDHVRPHAPGLAHVEALPPGVAAEVGGEGRHAVMQRVAITDQPVNKHGLLTALEVLDHARPQTSLVPGKLDRLILRRGEGGQCGAAGEEGEWQHRKAAADDSADQGADRGTVEHETGRAVAEVCVVLGVEEAHGEVRLPRHREHADAHGPLHGHHHEHEHHEVDEPGPPDRRIQAAVSGAVREDAIHYLAVQDRQQGARQVVPSQAEGGAEVHVHSETDDDDRILHADAVDVHELKVLHEVGQGAHGADNGSAHGHVRVVSEDGVQIRPEDGALQEANGNAGLAHRARLVRVDVEVVSLAPDGELHADHGRDEAQGAAAQDDAPHDPEVARGAQNPGRVGEPLLGVLAAQGLADEEVVHGLGRRGAGHLGRSLVIGAARARSLAVNAGLGRARSSGELDLLRQLHERRDRRVVALRVAGHGVGAAAARAIGEAQGRAHGRHEQDRSQHGGAHCASMKD